MDLSLLGIFCSLLDIRNVDNSGNLFLLAWTIMATFLIMAFNCNLRACLIKNDFEDPVGKLIGDRTVVTQTFVTRTFVTSAGNF